MGKYLNAAMIAANISKIETYIHILLVHTYVYRSINSEKQISMKNIGVKKAEKCKKSRYKNSLYSSHAVICKKLSKL